MTVRKIFSELQTDVGSIMRDEAHGMYTLTEKKALINEAQDLFVLDAPCIREVIHATILPTFSATPTHQLTKPLGTPVMTGGGLNDFACYGLYTGNDVPVYVVLIQTQGTPDTFQWQKDGVIQASGVAITSNEQLLENGIYIKFTATTGHTAGNLWTFSPSDISIIKDTERGNGVYIYGVNNCIGLEACLRVDSAAADDVGPQDERKLELFDEDWLDTLNLREREYSYPVGWQPIQPDKFILWVHPSATDNLTVELWFRREPRTLVGDNDVSLLPKEYHRALPYGAAAIGWERNGQTGMADLNWKFFNSLLADANRKYNCEGYRPKARINPRLF